MTHRIGPVARGIVGAFALAALSLATGAAFAAEPDTSAVAPPAAATKRARLSAPT